MITLTLDESMLRRHVSEVRIRRVSSLAHACGSDIGEFMLLRCERWDAWQSR
jgi:hypothetical protein